MYGSKADNLIKMKEAGINVPAFEIIEFGEEFDEKKFEAYTRNVAVRSCCNLEDGADQSFAGQFATYLNVKPGEIAEKIAECRNSVNAESVLAYMDNRGLKPDALKMCVIVQDMVNADRAGVLFTANPQGLLNESVIACGRGLGEGVVSGSSDTTTYYYHLTDKLYYYEGKEDLLSSDEIDELIEVSTKIKELFGEYLDIEFAFSEGRLYILQGRPITTIKAENPLILDNSNIVESYPGLSLPLTISFVHMVYSGVFRGVSRRVLKNDKELNKHADVFNNMVGHANGRMYYKISNWYTVLKFLPFNKRIIPVWQEMLGVKNKSVSDKDVVLTPFVRIMTYVNSFYELVSVPRHMRSLEEEFVRVNDHFYDCYDPAMDLKELIGLYDEVKDKLLSIWDVTLLNDMYAFIYTGLVKSRLRKKSGQDDAFVNRYISGITDIESMKPVKALIELAYKKDELSEEEFKKSKAEYIRLYGDRNLEELKLERRTFRSTPSLLDERIAEYRKDPERLKKLYEDINKSETLRIKTDPITRFLGKRCARGIAGREKSRLNRSRIYGIVRLIFDTMGSRFAEAGLIDKAEDIYYLTVDEAFRLVSEPADMKSVIAERKDAYSLYEMLPPYTRLIFEESEFDKRHSCVNSHKKKNSENVLQGVPCSGSVAEGEALVISGPGDAHDVKDKILVTKMTDPGWVFLLATAKGVISEKGSLLSHTAIISRELNIPSVVGVDKLTDTVKTGDMIRMDGGTGRIEIIGRA
ncbi:MAG: phosphoenolpyruvate synthase [Lachnospiraceae bacterium]|nr:phosphoenolpyruvate synthase [Lachnospiraceae bacterium]